MADLPTEPIDDFASRWFHPVLKNGSRFCAENIEVQMRFPESDGHCIPIAVKSGRQSQAWICCPRTQYFSYAGEEILRHGGRGAGLLGKSLLKIGGWGGFWEGAVTVNAWLTSTAAFPEISERSLRELAGTLQRAYPKHAIIFRGVNRVDNPLVSHALAKFCLQVPSRIVWLYKPGDPASTRSKDLARDKRLLRDGQYEVVDGACLRDTDFDRVAHLYRDLYLCKYPIFNPSYTGAWIRSQVREGLIDLKVLRDKGGIMACEGSFTVNGGMTSPVVGYDTNADRNLKLYRRAACIPVLKCHESGVALNLSAGVGRFKRMRGGRPAMEFNYVNIWHLSGGDRLMWNLTARVAGAILRHAERVGL